VTRALVALAVAVVLPGAARADAPRGEIQGTLERGERRMEWRAFIPAQGTDLPLLVGLHGRAFTRGASPPAQGVQPWDPPPRGTEVPRSLRSALAPLGTTPDSTPLSRSPRSFGGYFLDVGREAPADLPVAVLAPKIDWDAPWLETQRMLFALIDDLAARYPIDRTRVAVLGFSMGASSALHLARHNPSRFSAVWAASGLFPDVAVAHLARQRTRVILSWSGGAGQCAETRALARAIDRGRAEARAIVFEGGAHEPHVEMFRDRGLLEWFVGRSEREDPVTSAGSP
jgi:hypothetical protein